ncbi:MAG: MFS transporter [Phycisphaerae bacterium]|nr:MFS transporter [Phycisphaerae bacterium]
MIGEPSPEASASTAASSPLRHALEDTSRLPLGTKLSYGISTFGNGLFEFSLMLYLFSFYTDIMKVPAQTVGLVVSIAILVDALTDIPMGWLSDRTRTRWGRRRPYIILSACFYGPAFFLMFTPPTGAGGLYLFLTATAFYLGATVYLVPYNGLGTELTLDHHERTSLMAYRQAFYIIGLVCGAGVKVVALKFADERTGFAIATGFCGVVMTLTMLETVRGTSERPEFSQARTATPRPRFGEMIRNRPFMIILRTFVIYNVGILFPVVIGQQVATHWLQAEHVFPYAVMVFLFCGAVAVPVWTAISRRIDKRPTLILALLLAAVAMLPMLLLTPERVWLFVILLGVMGVAFGGFMTLPYSIIGDTVDYDGYMTGRRREGFYWGTAEFCRKISGAVAFAVIGHTLGRLGYEEGAVQQSTQTLTGLKILFIGAPMVLFALAAVSFWSYPLTKERHDEMYRQMKAADRTIADHDAPFNR